MNPSTLNVYELFFAQRRYVVPLYQRPYVWDEEAEWLPLWQDVRGRAEAVVQRRAGVGSNGQVHPHFLGALVTRQRLYFGRQLAAKDVIDGQQRLTTLQLFLASCRDLLRETGATDLADDFADLTWHRGTVEREHERLKVWPTNADREPFRAVMEAGSADAVEAWLQERRRAWQGTPRMAKAYLFFREAVRTWLHDLDEERPSRGASAQERQEALFEAIRQHLQVVEIALEDDDDPQVIFETLNARGRPLLPSDLVRNYVFTQANRTGEDADALYERYWKAFDDVDAEPFWKEPVQFGRMYRERIVLFLFHFLTARTQEEFGVRYLYATFKRWWDGDDGPGSVEDGLALLRRYAREYRRIVAPEGTSRFDRFLRRLEALEVTTFHPALLHLLVERDLDEAELDVIGAMLESYLVRRQVCGLTSKNLNRIGLSFLRTLKGADTVTPDSAQSALLANGDGPSVRWPDDREFRQAWLQRPLYRRLRGASLNMLLRALEDASRTRFQESIVIQDRLHVEHVMPRAWRDHWPEPEPSDDPEEPADLRRDRLVNTVGNLTLLTKNLNGKVSNGPFERKRPEIAEQSALRLNAYFQGVEAWDEAAIRRRGEALFERALEVWPFPSGVERHVDVESSEVASVGQGLSGTAPSGLDDVQQAIENRDYPVAMYFNRGSNWIQVKVPGWWRSVHYEYLEDGDEATLGIDVELTSHQWARSHVVDMVRGALPSVESAFPGYEVAWRDETQVRRALQVRLAGEDREPERIADGMARLVASTAEELIEPIRTLRNRGKSEDAI